MIRTLSATALSLLLLTGTAAAEELKVKISADLPSISVTHNGQAVTIQRNQDSGNTISDNYARTSRNCPPFCVQPMSLAPGVETIGELEVLDYLQRKEAGDETILVIDSRTADWVEQGTIPGSINIPWNELNPARGADPFSITDILESRFGAVTQEGLWDFSQAKTLVMYCNGPWCGQSPANIRTLLKFGYPAHKIKWYRGGMQGWESLGLTTVPGKAAPSS